MKKIIIVGFLGLLVVIVGFCLYILFGSVKVAAQEKEVTRETPLAVVPLAERPVPELVKHFFEEDHEVMLAIFMAESKLNPQAKNWNCQYTNASGKKYSTSCKTVEDRAMAWSVDCGVAQINTRGKECPKELYDPAHNLSVASQKLDTQGLGAWSVYNNGSYKKYLHIEK